MTERTATFETEHGPKTYTAAEIQVSMIYRDAWKVSKNGEDLHVATESRADFVRKLHRLFCTSPQDETVGEILAAMTAETSRTLVLYHDGSGSIRKQPEYSHRLADLADFNGSPLAAIASLAKKEPTRGEVFDRMRVLLQNEPGCGGEARWTEIREVLALAEELQATEESAT